MSIKEIETKPDELTPLTNTLMGDPYRYAEGDAVTIVTDIVNDGTVHGMKRGERIVAAGTGGFVSRKGTFLDNAVYDVTILEDDLIVGCREHELVPVLSGWTPPAYGPQDRVRANVTIAFRGKTVAVAGALGVVTVVRYLEEHGHVYEIDFVDYDGLALVFERQISLLVNDDE